MYGLESIYFDLWLILPNSSTVWEGSQSIGGPHAVNWRAMDRDIDISDMLQQSIKMEKGGAKWCFVG